jgi:hypothetical protein
MAEPRWKGIFEKLSEAERKVAKEILRRNLEREGQEVSEEVLEQMTERAVKDARAMIQKKGKQTLRGVKSGLKAFLEEFKREADQ